MSKPLMTCYFWNDADKGDNPAWEFVGSITRDGEKRGSFCPEGYCPTRELAVEWAKILAGELGCDYAEGKDVPNA